MKLDELTLGEIKQLRSIFPNEKPTKSHSLQIGQAYFIRTVTMYFTGMLVAITDSDFVLNSASWIPDTGRYMDFIRSGHPTECEPVGDGLIINRETVVDITPWNHDLPLEQK